MELSKRSAMKSFLFFATLTLCSPFSAYSQIGPLQVIDSSSSSLAISGIVSADIDQNGYNDIIASFSGSSGKVGYYLNQNGSFSALQVLDTVPFSEDVATGDFNQDGWEDVIMIGAIDFRAFLYWNNNGNFSPAVVIDSNISVAVKGVVTGDFDNNGSDDIVIIGQHSIDYYRNNGNGVFNKEPILTTSTSPYPLECLDLAKADFNGDGNSDLVCAETAGLVVYINSGTGVFTPHYYSPSPEIGWLVHPFDIDGDGDMDAMMRKSSGTLEWYSNDGTGSMTFESLLTTIPQLHSFTSIDYDNDGREDIYASYLYHISIFLNDSNHTFSVEVPIATDSLLYMDELCLADVDQDNQDDYVWSGYSRFLGYHINLNSLFVPELDKPGPFSLYPNPATDVIFVHSTASNEFAITVRNAFGNVVFQRDKVFSDQKLMMSQLPAGIYTTQIQMKGAIYSEKLIVQ
jgi:hypothetical protein